MTEKPYKLAVETNELEQAQKRLDKLKQDKADFDAIGKLRSSDQIEAGSRVTKALAESGEADTIQADIRAKVTTGMIESDPILKKIAADKAAAQAKIKAIRQGPNRELRNDEIAAEFAKIQAGEEQGRQRLSNITGPKGEAEAAAGELFGRATSGKDDESVDELGRMLRQIGRGRVADKLEGAKPSTVESERLTKEAEKDEKDEAAANKKRSDAAIHAFDTETDAVEKEAKAKRTAEDRSRTATTSFERGRGKSEAREIAEQVGAISEAGTIDEWGGAMAAQFRGGLGGRNGRALPENAQFNQLADMIRAEVRAEHPKMGRAESDLVAQQMAKTAFKSVDALGVMVNSQDIMLERLRDAEKKIGRLGAHAVTLNEGARHRQTTIPGS